MKSWLHCQELTLNYFLNYTETQMQFRFFNLLLPAYNEFDSFQKCALITFYSPTTILSYFLPNFVNFTLLHAAKSHFDKVERAQNVQSISKLIDSSYDVGQGTNAEYFPG